MHFDRHGDVSYIRAVVSHVPLPRHRPTQPAIMRVRPAVHCRCRYLISTSLEPCSNHISWQSCRVPQQLTLDLLSSGGPWAPCSS